MSGRAYYNDNDAYAAEWLRNLVAEKLITDGRVDGRPIEAVRAHELEGYERAHFFAGVAGWERALELAEWPRGREIWTGSCPCQPWSGAGPGLGFEDERHLWPIWAELIRERRPSTVVGEQVESPDGARWFDVVCSDLEGMGYAVGAAVLPASSSGAAHTRHRLFFVADAESGRRPEGIRSGDGAGGAGRGRRGSSDGGSARAVDDPDVARSQRLGGPVGDGDQPRRLNADQARSLGAAGAVGGFWADADWILCRDNRWRPVEPGTFPLADGVPDRVGQLRAWGNAIAPPVADYFSEGGAACSRPVRCGCGHEFDADLLGRFGCPNCEGEGMERTTAQRKAAEARTTRRVKRELRRLCFTPTPALVRILVAMEKMPEVEREITRDAITLYFAP